MTRESCRSSMTSTGSLCSTTQVARPVSPGCHGRRYSAAWTPRAVSGVSRPPTGSTISIEMLSEPTARQPVGDLVEDRLRIERRQDRLGDLEQARAGCASCRSSASDCVAQPLGRVGVGDRLGGEAGVDHEQPQVVVAELVQPELREDEDAEDLVLERASGRGASTRRGRPRCPGSCRPGGRSRRRAGSGRPVLGDPAGDALAELDLRAARASRRRTRRPGPASRPGSGPRRRAGRRGRCGSR